MRTRFNPCGMIWTYLRSCYKFTMRVFIGGQERLFPARWYFCLPGAKYFPCPHGGESSVWLKNYERNDAWGEVTPYPTDPNADDIRGLDRGLNPGYPGQSFVGQFQWFVDGMLPADVLSGPAPPMCTDCLPPPAVAAGGLVFGGQGLASGSTFGFGSGGLVFGGQGLGSGSAFGSGSGGLVMGGSGAPYQSQAGAAAGGLVFGGSGAGSQGGGGGVITPCCPGVLVPSTLQAVGPLLGTFTLNYDGTNWVYKGALGTCPAGQPNLSLICDINNTWRLTYPGGSTQATSGSCSPTFSQTFAGVNLSQCGGSLSLTVVVHQ
jgi:hypothetical protein